MHTLLEILRKSEELLVQRGIKDARLDAEHLIANTLGCRRMDLYLQFDRPMNEEILSQLRPKLARRARREPLSYILQYHPFHEISIECGPNALIPRPETEELVEKAITHLSGKPTRIVDLGTGSGAIALALKTIFPEAEVLGVDQSTTALSLAKTNGAALELSIRWTHSMWFQEIDGVFDLIISNPPYLTEDEWASSEPEVKDHEPREALVATKQGFADIEHILRAARDYMDETSLLALETGIQHRDQLEGTAKEIGFSQFWVEKDFSGRDRFFFARV